MARVRVLVVDDSLTVRRRIVEVLQSDPELEVVGEAEDGRRCIELCQQLRPDVITLDMVMPVMSGLAATEYIMAYFPTPIVIVSASMNRGDVFRTYEALAAGAIEVVEKPRDDGTDDDWESRLIFTVKVAARVKVITHPRLRLGSVHAAARLAGARSDAAIEAIAIGASTGGPGAVVEILRGLPASLSVPILLVVHIDQAFGKSFAEWLDGQSSLRVRLATDGERLPARDVVMAPPDQHLVLRDGRLHLTRDAARHSCRPSVDTLFESVAAQLGRRVAACLLTGMGRDGAEGLLAVRRAGGATIAQDEATSIVFGMPREAIALGAALHVLPLERIAPMLATLAEARSRP
ncbi:MAG TPA: chemotaxis-specific protein-glutamate methyltransferase CheB [Polyangia bacterium]|nr:chemotaxis-specific protein-glutamate methyltransferase CheB [Polyangia bacterium]